MTQQARYLITVGDAADGVQREAARVFAERLARRVDGPVEVASEASLDASVDPAVTVHIGTATSSDAIALAAGAGMADLVAELGPDGYALAVADDRTVAWVAGGDDRGVLYGLGRLLRAGDFADGTWTLPRLREVGAPVMGERAIYFATHLGNWLVNCSVEELSEYVEDCALWGASELLTWFDIAEVSGIDARPSSWDRLAELDQVARRIGLRVGRVVVANEGYDGQAPAHLRTRNVNHRHSPKTDICPSEPEGRAMILANKHELFSRIPHLDRIWLWPYDHGGCNCDRCAPWPRTFFELSREVAGIARQYHPNVDIGVSAWWVDLWHPDEQRPFFDALPGAADWCDAVLWSERESARWGHGHLVPEPFRFVFFPEIAMFDSANKLGIPWGAKGANPAPRRFARQFADHAPYASGFASYSEGRFDDINKAIWLQLAWDPTRDVREVLADYARYEFGGPADAAAQLILDVEPVLLARAVNPELDEVAAAIEAVLPAWGVDGWRWEMLRLNARMHAIRERLNGTGDEQPDAAERAALEHELRAHWDHLQFDLYRHDPARTRDPNLYMPFERLDREFRYRRRVGAIPIEDELFPPLLVPAVETKTVARDEYGSDHE